MLAPMRCWSWAVPLALFLGACQTRPPPNWAQGGSTLEIPPPLDTRRPEHRHHARRQGPVRWRAYVPVDRAGRIYEPDDNPIAVLQADGQLVGSDTSMGKIGLRNASLPGKRVAWLSLGEQGEVQRFDAEGEAHPDGAWAGCGPAIPRARSLPISSPW